MVSDVGLAKVCRKLVIPLPGLGYWARRQAGQKLSRPPLPPVDHGVRLRKTSPPKEQPKSEELGIEEERAQLLRLEEMSTGDS